MDQLIRTISAAFGLTAFLIAVLAGLAASNPAVDVVLTALVCAVIGRIIGTLGGMVLAHVVQQHLDHYKLVNPIPTLLTADELGNEEVVEVGEASTESNAS